MASYWYFLMCVYFFFFFFFFQAEDGIRDIGVTGVQTCALPISEKSRHFRCACVNVRVGETIYPCVAACPAAHGSPSRKLRLLPGICRNERVRSEERRVGKECKYRWWAEDAKKKKR